MTEALLRPDSRLLVGTDERVVVIPRNILIAAKPGPDA
jgi:hypothetical protein